MDFNWGDQSLTEPIYDHVCEGLCVTRTPIVMLYIASVFLIGDDSTYWLMLNHSIEALSSQLFQQINSSTKTLIFIDILYSIFSSHFPSQEHVLSWINCVNSLHLHISCCLLCDVDHEHLLAFVDAIPSCWTKISRGWWFPRGWLRAITYHVCCYM